MKAWRCFRRLFLERAFHIPPNRHKRLGKRPPVNTRRSRLGSLNATKTHPPPCLRRMRAQWPYRSKKALNERHHRQTADFAKAPSIFIVFRHRLSPPLGGGSNFDGGSDVRTDDEAAQTVQIVRQGGAAAVLV